MTEETRNDKLEESLHDNDSKREYHEETAAEIASPVSWNEDRNRDRVEDKDSDNASVSGRVIGWSALALSVLSLFFLPVILGAAGIILGFVARRRNAETLGAWSIGIGVVSIIIGIFVLPFF